MLESVYSLMSNRAFLLIAGLTIMAAGCKSGGDASTPTADTKPKTNTADAKPTADAKTDAPVAKIDPSNVVGTWTGEVSGEQMTVSFKPDKTFEVSGELKNAAKKIDMNIAVTGTYKMDADKMTIHYAARRANGKTPESKTSVDQFMKTPPQPDETDTIEMTDKDTMTMIDPKGQKQLMKRKAG
jgi:hypothetical protein